MQADFNGRVASFTSTDKGAEVVFDSCGPEEAGNLIATFFAGVGLRLEKGSVTNGTYGSGSGIGRIAAGGFAARSKFTVEIVPHGTGVRASVASAMSGMSGGVLGVVKEKKQRAKVAEGLRAYLAA